MLKKFMTGIFVFVVALFISTIVNSGNAYAATPARDTWVMAFGMCDYYVKAGSLERIGSYHPDVAPSFRTTIITVLSEAPNSTSTDIYEFNAKGDVRVSVNGKFHSMTSQNKFTNKLYNAIVDKLL